MACDSIPGMVFRYPECGDCFFSCIIEEVTLIHGVDERDSAVSCGEGSMRLQMKEQYFTKDKVR